MVCSFQRETGPCLEIGRVFLRALRGSCVHRRHVFANEAGIPPIQCPVMQGPAPLRFLARNLEICEVLVLSLLSFFFSLALSIALLTEVDRGHDEASKHFMEHDFHGTVSSLLPGSWNIGGVAALNFHAEETCFLTTLLKRGVHVGRIGALLLC